MRELVSERPPQPGTHVTVRVVFLTHNYPRWSGDLAGSFLGSLAPALLRRGVEVRVVAPSDAGQGGTEVLDGVSVRRVRYAAAAAETLAYTGTIQAALRSPAGWRALLGLWRALRRGAQEEINAGADLIHAHWWVPAGLALPAGVRTVLTVHGTDAALLRRSRVARSLARPVFRRAQVITAVSQQLADWVEEGTGRRLDPLHVHPMPVETSHFRWSTGGGGALVIARLTAQKRVHLAVDAAARLISSGVPLRLTIVGDGPERGSLEQQVSRAGIGSAVSFAGAVPLAEIPGYLARADVMIFPARGEGFGLVAAEALMAGVPVVACVDGGGVLEVVPESGPGRIAVAEPTAIAGAVLSILEDPNAHQAARQAGEFWRLRLAPDQVAKICHGWYREAMSA
jgi:glycosyltransferase involved in cell wall biosynthesis